MQKEVQKGQQKEVERKVIIIINKREEVSQLKYSKYLYIKQPNYLLAVALREI